MAAETELAAPPAAMTRTGGESRWKAWGFTGSLVFLYVINWADKAVFGLVAQPLSEELGLSATQVGLAGSAFFLTFTIGGFFAGLVNKWMTLKWSLAILALAWAIAMLPLVFAVGFGVLLASRMTLGFFEGPSSALIHTGVYSWHPAEKRGLPSACVTAAASIAKIAIAPVLAMVVAAWGWRAALLVLAAASGGWCLLWLLTWREGPYGEQTGKKDEAEAETAKVRWTKIFLTPTFLGGAVAVFTMYSLVTMVLTWLPSYFETGLGYSRVEAGAMFGFPSIASLLFLLLSASIGDRLRVRGTSARILRGVVPGTGLLLCGLTLLTLPHIDVPWLAVLVVSVGYGLGTITFPLFNAGLSEICPPQQMAGTLGLFLALMATGGLLAPYLTGLIVDAADNPAAGYALAFQVFGAAAAVGAVIALLTVNPGRDARRVLG